MDTEQPAPDAETRSRAREDPYRALFEAVDAGCCILELVRDAEGAVADLVIRDVNAAFARHSGIAGAVGFIAASLRRGDAAMVWAAGAVCTEPRAWTPVEVTLFEDAVARTWAAVARARDGDVRRWSFSASAPGTLRDGRRFVVGMALDITDRLHAEEVAARDRAARTRDELRLPLTPPAAPA